MRITLALCLLFLVRGAMAQLPQQPPLPSPEKPASVVPAETPLPEPSVPQLIPSDILPASPPPAPPSLPQLDEAFKDKPISPTAADYRNRIEWRKLRNRAVNDPENKAALVRADAARTDLQKRKLLAKYYDSIYAKMLARAQTPELKAYLTARKNEEVAALAQPRVRPNLSPTPSPHPPLPTPTPAISPKPSVSPPPTGLPTPLPGTN